MPRMSLEWKVNSYRAFDSYLDKWSDLIVLLWESMQKKLQVIYIMYVHIFHLQRKDIAHLSA